MKKLLISGLLLLAAMPLFAQKVFFVYIQSDTRTPFYVKMGDKVQSATASGYLILSRLKDSTYAFQLGPSASEGELRFEVAINGKDRGFLLKKFPEGWGLFDLQTMTVIRPLTSGGGTSLGNRKKDNRFTTLLSQAADDTSLFYEPVVSAAVPVKKKGAEKESAGKEGIISVVAAPVTVDTASVAQAPTRDVVSDTLQQASVQSEENPVASKEQVANTEAIQPDTAAAREIVAVEPAFKRSLVTRKAESSMVDGFSLVYHDEIDGVVDTIKLVIPNQKVMFVETAPIADGKEPIVEKVAAPVLACNGQAGEKEFFRLRRNLAGIDSEDAMTKEAVAAFRKRCFSAEQVKNLSALFLTQPGKYGFLEAAYPYVYDRDNFVSLQSELFDPTYLARFKALTSN